MMEQCKEKLNIAMFGQKRIPSREGGVEIVVEELCTRMVLMLPYNKKKTTKRTFEKVKLRIVFNTI